MKILLFFYLLTLNIGHCQNIVIKYTGKSNDKVLLSYPVIGSNFEISSLSKEDRFLKIECSTNIIISSCDIKRSTKIFAEPNDTIEFYLDKKGLINYSCKNNPKRKGESEYINQSYQKYGPNETVFDKKLLRLSAKEYSLSEYIDGEYINELAFLESSYKNNLISTSFYECFKSIFWCLTLNNKLSNKPIGEETIFEIEKSFDNAENLINLTEYRNLLSDYLEIIIKKESTDNDLFTIMKLITKSFSNQAIIDYLLFDQIKKNQTSSLTKNGIDRNSILYFNENCKNKVFLKEVEQDFSTLDNPTILSEIIKQHKGKLILVDFWASWCMPCRKEFPYEMKLINKYPNVSFVFISIEKSRSAWKKASSQYRTILNINNSFLIDKTSQDEIMKKINVLTIPRYVLFGKNGEVINVDAPRPSSKEIEQLIEKHL